MGNTKGFSMLELLIVIAIVGILFALGSGLYQNFSKNVELTNIGRTMNADLRSARSKAMSREGDAKWGMHLVNSDVDYYELFSTPTTYTDASMQVFATTTFPAGVEFSLPLQNTTEDIIFAKVSGTTTPTTISLTAQNVSYTTTISAFGAIY